jgi:5-methylthioadenosine/S-adenosylhomocysteine deaminase
MSAAIPTRNSATACDLLIIGGRILDLSVASGVLDHSAIAVRDGLIVAVGDRADLEAAWHPAQRIDATGQVVAPGFVDAHVHLAAFLGAGKPYERSTGPGMFARGGRVEVVLPMVARMCSMPVPPELVAAVARPVFAAMLRAGITGVVDAGSPGVDGLVQAASEVGIRAAIGPSLADLWHNEHGTLVKQADPAQLLAAANDMIGRHDGSAGGRVRVVVSAVETMACSDELLAGIAALTTRHQVPTHVHTHISEATVRAHLAAFGKTPTRRLLDSGMLSPRCTAMHAGFLTDEDIAVFADTGVTVNHNPIGNAMLGFGTTAGRSVTRLLAAGVPIALGSDYAPYAMSTPFEMIRAVLMLQRDIAASDYAVTLEQALTMATHSGPSLGRAGQLGRIAVGHIADLVLVDTRGLHHLGTNHPIPALGVHARAADVTTVIVNGRVVVEGGRLVGIDEEALVADAREALKFAAAHH